MKLLGKPEIIERLHICERTLDGLVKRREFPPPLRLGKSLQWAEAVVDAWLEVQLQPQRDWKSPKSRKSAAKAPVPASS